MKLPQYIGHPSNSNAPNQAALDSGIDFQTKITQSLQIAYIQPLDTQISKDINIYTGRKAWDDYVKLLGANGVSAPETIKGRPDHIACVCSVLTPFSETYSNEYGQSDMLRPLQSFNENGILQDASFIAGGLDVETLKGKQNSVANAVGNMLDWTATGAGTVSGYLADLIGADGASVSASVYEGVANPATKLDVPTLWRGNSYSCSYDLSIKLTCFNARNDSDFGNNIVAPLIALLQFVAPRSQGGKFYKWPFLMKLTIPGTVYMPLGYCSSMTVLKGGDVNDISWCGRPNMVDVRMSITSVYNTCVNAENGNIDSDRPSLVHQVKALMDIDDRGGLKKPKENQLESNSASNQVYKPASGGATSNQNRSPTDEQILASQKLYMDQLNN